jgi:hemoglobin/transferrin/lactoferrin receptor protein
MIRGFAANRLFYSVYGVRMNTAIFRSGNIQNIISLDAFSVEHSEIILGAAPVVYGSDGIGGVMMFQTLQPMLSHNDKLFITGNAVVRYSSANTEKTGHFDINIGGEKWGSVTSISYNNFGDLRMGSNGPNEYLRNYYAKRTDTQDVTITNTNPLIQIPTGYSQYNILQKIYFEPNNNLNFTYSLIGSETSDNPRYDRLIRTQNENFQFGDCYYGPQK